jgi:hypothetical protein
VFEGPDNRLRTTEARVGEQSDLPASVRNFDGQVTMSQSHQI